MSATLPPDIEPRAHTFVVEGTARTMNAVVRFPSKEAALGLYNDPDYQEAKRIRQASTRNVSMVLAREVETGS